MDVTQFLHSLFQAIAALAGQPGLPPLGL